MSTTTHTPASEDDLVEVVRQALDDDRPLEILGAGSKRAFGRPIENAEALSMREFADIHFYEPEELVMSVGAGTKLAEIEAQLAGARQQLAFEPADYGALLGGAADEGTIGGVFACNLAGPRRLKAGAARDHLLGLRAVTGRGDAIATGGRVMKNVTGYDLCKLLTGSFGTMAAMTEVTFKVLPAPERTRTLLVSRLALDAALAALRRAMGTAFDVSAAACLPDAAIAASSIDGVSGVCAALRLEGAEPSVAYRIDALTSALAEFGGALDTLDDEASIRLWRELRDVRVLPAGGTMWRISVPPSDAAACAAALDELGAATVFDWAGGLIWAAFEGDAPVAEAVRAAIGTNGGHATLVRAGNAERAETDVFQPQPPPLAALSRRIKDAFDPRRILNRGRMYAGC